jgi:hypothetical protein
MMVTQGELVYTRRPCHSSHTMTRKKPKGSAVLRGTSDDACREGALANVVIYGFSRSPASQPGDRLVHLSIFNME